MDVYSNPPQTKEKTMKYKLTKEEFEKLDDSTKKEYTLSGDTATLKIEGEGAPSAEAVTVAEEKLRIEREHRKNAEKSRDEAESRAEKLSKDLENANGKEEIKRLNEEHQKELERIRNEREAEQKQAQEARNAALIKETAKKFADDNFTVPDLMIGPFSQRLSVEEVNGEPVVRVLDAEGKPSVLSLAELQKEFLDNKAYSSIIKENPGSGGGATPSGGGGGAPRKKLSEMTATEEAKFEREDPDGYKAALNEEFPS